MTKSMTKQHIRVKPDIDLNAPEGMTMFSFDRSLIMDMAVLLKEVPLPQTANDLQCKLCTKKINQNGMRGHVAWHILTEDLVGHCGYCGRGGSCTSVLKKAARKMGKQYHKVENNCSYFVQLTKLLRSSQGMWGAQITWCVAANVLKKQVYGNTVSCSILNNFMSGVICCKRRF